MQVALPGSLVDSVLPAFGHLGELGPVVVGEIYGLVEHPKRVKPAAGVDENADFG
jgi:hypothetical protein